MEPSNWAPEHSDALRQYLAEGLSFSEVGRKINARFGTSYTRSAVLGRAKRMRLGEPPRVDGPPLVPLQPGETGPAPSRPAFPQSRTQPPKSAYRPADPVRLRCVGIRPRLISLLELEPGDCRYPYGGDKEGEEIRFCGHPKHPGTSYCAPHVRLTSGPGAGPERTRPVVLRLVAAA